MKLRLDISTVSVFTAALLVWAVMPAEAQTLSQVFKQVSHSVVVIRTKESEVAIRGQGQVINVTGVGSGVLISPDGKVITAAHVVHTADAVSVEFLSGEVVRGTVIASEPQADVALLQLERVPPGVTVAPLGDSDRMEVGDQIFIVGAPFGIGHTLTTGHISARHKPNTTYSGMAELFQTDAAINRGNSGGPMFSMAGEVVGVVSHIISRSGAFEGVGFVVTSNMARRLLLERQSFWTGMEGYVLSGQLASVFNLPQPVGVLVQRVAKGSPAAAMGLRAGIMQAAIGGETLVVGGDIILQVQGIPIRNESSYQKIQERLSRLHPGATVTVTELREGRAIELAGQLP